jgi:hypothetical protein
MKVLGVKVAHDPDEEATAMRNKLAGIAEMAEKVIKLKNAQVELILLRYLFLSYIVYFLRNNVPAVIKPELLVFDGRMDDIFQRWVRSETMTQQTRDRAHLPLRMGGLGLRSSAKVVLPAFAAAVEAYHAGSGPEYLKQNREAILERLKASRERGEQYATDVLRVESEILVPARTELEHKEQARRSPSALPDVGPPTRRTSKNDGTPSISQSMLLRRDDLMMFKQLWEQADVYTRATFLAADADGAFSCFRALPTERGLRVPDALFREYVRQYMGISLVAVPVHCKCAARVLLTPNNPASYVHLASCKAMGGVTMRHDHALGFLATIGKSIPGIVTRVEQKEVLKSSRLDAIFTSDKWPTGLILDTTIAHYQVDSVVSESAKKSLVAAKRAESHKNSKYKKKAESEGYQFQPMVWETSGAMSRSTNLFLRKLAAENDMIEPYVPVNWAAPTRFQYWSQRISVIIARGTALAARNLYRQCLR